MLHVLYNPVDIFSLSVAKMTLQVWRKNLSFTTVRWGANMCRNSLSVTVVYLRFRGPNKSFFLTHRISQSRKIESSLYRHFVREKTIYHTIPKHHIHKRQREKRCLSLFLRCFFVMTFSPVFRNILANTVARLRWRTVLVEVAQDNP